MTVTLFLAQAAAPVAVGAAADAAHERVEVPSGAEVWLQEEITDRVPGMGLVARFRFVMPALEDVVPAVDPADLADHLPADMVEGMQDTRPLSPAEQAELDAALGDLVIEAVPDQGHGAGAGDPAWGGAGSSGISITPVLPGDGGEIDAPLPSELAAPDAALPGGDGAADEAGGDLAAVAGEPGAMDGPVLPAAPDLLMQDPVHRDIQFLCENYALPRLKAMNPRPTQIVISMASAPSPFGSFDPAIVQLFEGFSVPRDREACVWEPM
ncbi:DUF6497 family protein [Paracoccus sanguinis]|uniref:DUF6497 family protein n=1 Tax=Paracoccus sanguinis TaxID=1545044 RepID=UPI00051F97C3|nr:DUF6497 family protein [Paracoccus sanguinis]KGJ17498.1 hypothetical protein IX55_12940 [Paracoccus sanguinis]